MYARPAVEGDEYESAYARDLVEADGDGAYDDGPASACLGTDTDSGLKSPRAKDVLNGDRGEEVVGDTEGREGVMGEAEGDWRFREKKAALGIFVVAGGWAREASVDWGWGKAIWVPTPFMTAIGIRSMGGVM